MTSAAAGRGTAAPPAAAPPANATLGRRLVRSCFAFPLYGWTLAGRRQRGLVRRPEARWPGDPLRGRAMLNGELRFAGETVRDPAPIWHPPGASAAWLAEFHGFAWLADLLAAGGGAARETGRAFVRTWLEAGAAWQPVPWRADVLATRLVAWLTHLDDLTSAEAGDLLRPAMIDGLARQARHLRRVARWEAVGARRLRALKGLVFAELALAGGERRLRDALARLEVELAAQIKPDGGHVSRSPAVQVAVLQDLIDLRAALRGAVQPVPAPLQASIDRMAPLVRFFRHGDGRLAQFNGTSEEFGPLVDLVLARSEAKGKAPASAPHSGFQRLQAGKTVLVVDAGPPPPPGLDDEAHAGTLSFEMSHGRERLVVNCGAFRGPNPEWRRIVRQTAAHSTAVVGDTNSAEIRPDGALGRRPVKVVCERADDADGVGIAASHDGFATPFGIVHSRTLFLAADGEDVRGEDRLSGRAGESFSVRFHLHPMVEVSIVQDGAAALLHLPGGTVWRLRAQGAQLGLSDSVYLAAGEMRKTQQIVLTGPTGTQDAVVRWAIRRDARRSSDG